MFYNEWILSNDEYDHDRRQSRNALFTIGNGYLGIRGFFEEDEVTLESNGGIYMAGVTGRGTYDAWEGKSGELCNMPNIFRVSLRCGGERVDGFSSISDFKQTLNMQKASYSRQYIWTTSQGSRIEVAFERFAGAADIPKIGQRIIVKALDPVDLSLSALLDSNVTNLNADSFATPRPVQPGRNHFVKRNVKTSSLSVILDDPDSTVLYFAQQATAKVNGNPVAKKDFISDNACGAIYDCSLKAGDILTVEKVIYVASSLDDDVDAAQAVAGFLSGDVGFEQEFRAHCTAWLSAWETANIKIDTDTNDDAALRYNIFELLCVCPRHTDRVGIGARGLTGEMYEGCIFWDNEIFVLPFFQYTNPQVVRKQLTFRYHTLDAARRHAKRNWFEGAMYPWQVNNKGIEQTPYECGAFYAIHIVADIAFAVCRYWEVTGDDEFMVSYGTEILYETARFWRSRCDFSELDGKYHIRAVRGPNEYDVYVNNNAYTNYMAANNLRSVKQVFDNLSGSHPKEIERLMNKLGATRQEIDLFNEIADKIIIPYDEKKGLILEDDTYTQRRSLDLKRAKPTGQRIIDSTMPYEALPLYQVTKQADTVLLCCLYPNDFTQQQKKNVYFYYEPRTAHDSSLSYAPHAILSSQIGLKEEAYGYFEKSAYLDISDRQLNTISGLHFANFGGTWQAVFHGFCGISDDHGKVSIKPSLPDKWNRVTLNCFMYGSVLQITIDKSSVVVHKKKSGPNPLIVRIEGGDYLVGGEPLRVTLGERL
ncbi:MAG: glycoside hydrolase family 65 protein [Clostridiales bacterium]|nr:glycoside hydrolase family 65 protein [Clostridiales bacterium]